MTGMPTIFANYNNGWKSTEKMNSYKNRNHRSNFRNFIGQSIYWCTESVIIKRRIEEAGGMRREERETIYVVIPKGADDGEIIVVNQKEILEAMVV